MRHKVHKKKFGRQSDHTRAMLKNLTTSLILYEKIKTTRAKAKAVAPRVEKLITLARAVDKGKVSVREAIRRFESELFDENASRKLVEELGKRYAKRESGFTRMIALRNRSGDAAPVVQIELITH